MNRDLNGTATGPVSIDAGCHTRYHVVKRGETLAMIATAYFGDPALAGALFEANSDVLPAPDAVVSGQTLRIPRGVEVDR
jgi:nucleoid-associated protein YgaU